MFYITTVDKLLGQTVNYGTVYKTMSSAKKSLSSSVAASRKQARNYGYGMVYSHWNLDRTSCELTHGKDRNSRRWDLLVIKNCEAGIPYTQIVD